MTKLPEFPEEFLEVRKLVFRPVERLRAYKAFYEAGVIAALMDALTLIRDAGSAGFRDPNEPDKKLDIKDVMSGPRLIPFWVLEGARNVVEQQVITGVATGKKGPHANSLKQSHDHHIDLVRYFHMRKLVEDGSSILDAAHLASIAFERPPYAAAEETMQKSYAKVTKALKTERGALRYYFALRGPDSPVVNAAHDI